MRLLRGILEYCFPTGCSHCGSRLGNSPIPFFCSSCWLDLSPLRHPVCPRCGRPLGSPEALSASPEHVCWHCRKDPPDVDQALAAGIFEGPLREAIHVYKYRPLMALGRPLADWMTEHVRKVERLDLVMPVPLHVSRLRKRGFNQALLLASGASRAYAVPLHYDNLVRVRPTQPQVELSGKERVANVTGATMNECSRVLREAGAEAVIALTLARTAD